MSDADGRSLVERLLAPTREPTSLKAVGTAALLGAVVVAVAPGLLSLVGLGGPGPSVWLAFPLGLLALALAVRAFRSGAESDDGTVPRPDYETRDTADAPRVGEAIDDRIEDLAGDDADADRVREGVVGDVRRRLRETVVDAMVTGEGVDRETANESVREGTWTDDPRARAFLGGEAAPPMPVWLRIADWLRGAPSVRRIEATVDAIERRADVERTDLPGSVTTVDSARDDSEDDGADDREEAVERLEAFLEDEAAASEPRTAADGGDSR